MTRRSVPTSDLYPLYSKLYFSLGQTGSDGLGDVLPTLIAVAEICGRPQQCSRDKQKRGAAMRVRKCREQIAIGGLCC